MRGQKFMAYLQRRNVSCSKKQNDKRLSFVTEFRVAVLSENTVFCVIVAHGVITY